MKLRSYQYDCVLETEDCLLEHKSAAVCLATGLGAWP